LSKKNLDLLNLKASRKMRNQKTKLFYSYSHKDEKYKKELEKYLGVLQRQGIVSNWHFRRIDAGKEWDGEIKSQLNSAHIILLLVSPDYINSTYCTDIEVKRAMKRHRDNEAVVIPVILRPVPLEKFPFGKLQALPDGAKPITEWQTREEAFKNIAEGIRQVAEAINHELEDKIEMKKITRKAPKIIIFEDDKKWLDRIHDTLRGQKYKIETYSRYDEKLLSRFAKHDYDLLITDIALDNVKYSKDGIVLAKFVRAFKKNIPIIVVKGYSFDDVWDVVDHIVESKIDHLFIKSKWDPAKFLKAVKDALEKRKAKST
jgi:CheY-like chemotaxis protein